MTRETLLLLPCACSDCNTCNAGASARGGPCPCPGHGSHTTATDNESSLPWREATQVHPPLADVRPRGEPTVIDYMKELQYPTPRC